MTIKLFNTLTRKKEIFKPIHKGHVGFYACGPTVYNYAHIGNLRTYIFEDVLKRTLQSAGYTVNHIMNITDVDDKTIMASVKEKVSLKTFTKKYESFFKDDLKKLNIIFPTKFVRATEHIDQMIIDIGKLKKKKFAYEKDGSIYFDVSKFKSYGNLSRLNKKGLRDGASIDQDEYAKEDAKDFVLWKARKDNEPFWQSPFGQGRPGWHIECSTMATHYLGQPIDIHAAGVDLIFPHHENEIAQAEAINKKQFVKYWMHGEHLLVDSKKMSKLLGNIFTLH
ncbi:MAG: cysteine--tRNA ligase, partial [Patescibacteria group bacterium]